MNISYSKYEHPQLLCWKIMSTIVSNWLLWYFGMIGLRISFLLVLPVLQTDQNFWTFYYTIGVFFIGTDHSCTSYYYVNKKMAKALQLTIGCMSRYRIKLRKIELFHFLWTHRRSIFPMLKTAFMQNNLLYHVRKINFGRWNVLL